MEDRPVAFVVFGATSDLAMKKLYPTLYTMAQKNVLPEDFYLYGVARTELDTDAWRERFEQSVRQHNASVDVSVMDRLFAGAKWFTADVKKSGDYQALEDDIRNHEDALESGVLRLFYLALPPSLFADVARNVETCKMGKALCSKDDVLSRIIIEKPFGHDTASAKRLDAHLKQAFDEKQVYRIDHYLGKEAMQNVLVFRFGNVLFEPRWNNEHVKRIQIDALESVSAAGRAAYYDDAGALRDMVQSHLLQFLAYLTMEEPTEMTGQALHAAKSDILKHVRPWRDGPAIVRGQYAGYQGHDGVPDDSKTETYVAVKLEIDTDRWRGVPIYIRTGKALSEKETAATVEFKETKSAFFKNQEYLPINNLVRISIAPDSGVSIRANMHEPGTHMGSMPAPMHYCRTAEEDVMGDYEHLLMAAMRGKRLLFAGSDEVMDAWRVVEPLLQSDTSVKVYASGTRGPETSALFPAGQDWLESFAGCKMKTHE